MRVEIPGFAMAIKALKRCSFQRDEHVRSADGVGEGIAPSARRKLPILPHMAIFASPRGHSKGNGLLNRFRTRSNGVYLFMAVALIGLSRSRSHRSWRIRFSGLQN